MFVYKTKVLMEFLGDPVVKTMPSNVGGTGLLPHASGLKNQNRNRSNILTTSRETFKKF